jgi:raffinose/stachyose/melibiose transport system permease protein
VNAVVEDLNFTTEHPAGSTDQGPTECFEAARLEGGAWVKFRHVIIPLSRNASFTVILRAFMASIPREIDESAIIDGASPLRLFFSIILPLLWPAVGTVIVVQSVAIYNDFAGPLYFLPGSQNVTAQLTLFNFISQFNSSFNLLFADVVLITIPPLVMFLFFQRQIVAGMTAGAVKG